MAVYICILLCDVCQQNREQLTLKHFPTKMLHFLQAFIPKNIGIGNFKGQFLIITLPEKSCTILHTNGHISNSRRNMNCILVSNQSWKCAPYNDTKNWVYPKCHLFSVLWETGSASHRLSVDWRSVLNMCQSCKMVLSSWS